MRWILVEAPSGAAVAAARASGVLASLTDAGSAPHHDSPPQNFLAPSPMLEARRSYSTARATARTNGAATGSSRVTASAINSPTSTSAT
jgi:hypothetical protein